MKSKLREGFAVLALFSLYLATALGPAAASEIGYMQLSFSSSAGAGMGSGFVKYDPVSLNPFYEYRDALLACEESGDFDPCRNLPRQLGFSLSVTDAELRIESAVFDTEDFSWSFIVDGRCFFSECGRDTAFVNISNGIDNIFSVCEGGSGDQILRDTGLFGIGTCGDFFLLEYGVNGVQGDDSNGNFYWNEAPTPSPELGSLAWLGLGLLGVALSRRRKVR